MAIGEAKTRRGASNRHSSRAFKKSDGATKNKDLLDRIETLSKIAAAIAIPVVLAIGTWVIQASQTSQSVGKDYVSLAIQILQNKDKSPELIGLRGWAVALLDKESPIPLPQDVADGLISGKQTLASSSSVPPAYDAASKYWEQNNKDLAIEEFNLAETQDPKFPPTYQARGVLRMTKQAYSDAIPDFTKFIALNPEDPSGYFERGVCYSKTKQYDAAIKDLSKAIELNSKDGSALYERAMSYEAIGNDDFALKDLNNAIDVDKGHILAHYERAKLFLKRKATSQAISDLTVVSDYEHKFNDQHGILKEVEQRLLDAQKSGP
jgi:tetratricopeptide (TPR) repeat protein